MSAEYDKAAYIGLDEQALGDARSGTNLLTTPHPEDSEFEPNPPPKVSKRVQFVYGLGEIGIWGAGVIQGFYLLTFLLEVAGIEASVAGTLLVIGQVADAITNPVIGRLSDAIKTRFGRRKPWLVLSAIPFGLSYFGLFVTWDSGSEATKIVYYLVLLLLYNTLGNMIDTPYSALTAELGRTPDDATRLTRARMLFNIVAGVLVTLGHGQLIELWRDPVNPLIADYKKGYLYSGLIFGLIFAIPPMIVGFYVTEPPPIEEHRESTPGCKGVCQAVGYQFGRVFGVLKIRAYIMVTLVFLLSWTTVQFMQNTMFLHFKYVSKKEEHFAWITVCLQGVAAVALFLWSFLASKIGKKKVYFIGISIWIAANIPLYWEDATWPLWLHYLLTLPLGLGVSVVFLVPWSLVPDVIDWDELQHGTRREGVFFSLFVLFQKAGVAIALATSSYVLDAAGYIKPSAETIAEQAGDYQPESVIQALRIMVGPVPVAMLCLSIIAAIFYPLDRVSVANIRQQLEERRALLQSQNGKPATYS